MARHRLPYQTMPTGNSTSASGPIGVQMPPGLSQDSPPPTSTGATAPPPVSSSASEPGANRFRSHRDAGMRRQLNNRQRPATRASTSAASPQPAVAPIDENGNAGTAADGATANITAQAHSNSAGPTGGTTPGPADPAKEAADEQRLQDQIAQARNSKPSQLDGLSDSTRNDLMTQLGGHRNMDYEGTHQADEASKDMAKQSDRWGKDV